MGKLHIGMTVGPSPTPRYCSDTKPLHAATPMAGNPPLSLFSLLSSISAPRRLRRNQRRAPSALAPDSTRVNDSMAQPVSVFVPIESSLLTNITVWTTLVLRSLGRVLRLIEVFHSFDRVFHSWLLVKHGICIFSSRHDMLRCSEE